MRRKPSWAALKKAANERILIIDGAMGTMIQQHKLGESHYRGERFRITPRTSRATMICSC